jgi:ribosomal protein S18 acetylase RimI-like enzyme
LEESIQIRRGTLDDLPSIARLFDGYRQFYQQSPNYPLAESFIRERLEKKDSIIFLALDSEKALGFVQLYPSFSSVSAKSIWILNDLFVSPEAREKGIGYALLETSRVFAISTGAKRLVLTTAHTNLQAQKLYESFGYKLDGEFRTYTFEL